MERAGTRDRGPALQRLCERVTEWRGRRGSRQERIPEEMWREAVRVARVEGVATTSAATRLDYRRLRVEVRRAEEEQPPDLPDKQVEFVEARLEAPATAPGKAGLVVEWVSPRGHRMRLEAADAHSLDVGRWVEAFWSAES